VLAETPADRTTALALDATAGMDADEPFFLWVHYFDPHFPYAPPKHLAASFEDPYDGEVAFVDQQIGILLHGLRARDLLDTTLLAVASDHGEGLGEHGEPTHAFFLFDSTIRVPLILKGPGVASMGRSSRPLSATLLKKALLRLLIHGEENRAENEGAETPSAQFVLFLRGERPGFPSARAFSESLYCYRSFRWAQMTSIRGTEGKLIRGGRDEFYDLRGDPRERNPLPAAEGGEPARMALSILMDQSKTAAKSRFDRGTEFQKDLPGYFGGTLGRGGAFIEEEANRALPHPPDRSTAVNRLLRAVDLSASGGTNQARQLLEGLVAEDPDNPAALYWLARVLRDQGEAEGSPGLIEKAYTLFQKTLAIDPESADAFHMGVWCLLQIGDFDRAKEVLDARIRAGRTGAKTWELLGYLHGHRVSAGRINPFFDLEKAFLCFDRSLEQNKNNPLLLQKAVELSKKHDRRALQEHYLRMLDTLNSKGWR
jgi:Tfp pilus assembly protein PilF